MDDIIKIFFLFLHTLSFLKKQKKTMIKTYKTANQQKESDLLFHHQNFIDVVFIFYDFMNSVPSTHKLWTKARISSNNIVDYALLFDWYKM